MGPGAAVRDRYGTVALALVALGVLALGAGALGAGGGLPERVAGGTDVTASDVTTDAEVRLPGADATDAEVTLPDADEVGRADVVDGCEVVGCEAWRRDVGPGRVVVGRGGIYHLGDGQVSRIEPTSGAVLARDVTAVAEGRGEVVLHETGPREQRSGAGSVVLEGDGHVEVRDADDLSLRWELGLDDELVQGPFVVDGTLLVGLERDGRTLAPEELRLPEVRAFALEDGEPAWTADGFLRAVGGVLTLAHGSRSVLEVVDARTGAASLRSRVVDLRGTGGGHVGLRDGATVEVLTARGDPVHRHALGDDGDATLAGPVLLRRPAGPRADGVPAAGAELVDPTDGSGLDVLEDVRVLAAVPVDDGAVVLGASGGQLRVLGLDGEGRERWRTERPLDGIDPGAVTAWTRDDAVVVAERRGAGSREPLLRVEPATGLPVRPPPVTERYELALGDRELRWSGRYVEASGPDGTVRFGGGAEVLHPRAPLLLRDGDELIALDESMLGGRADAAAWSRAPGVAGLPDGGPDALPDGSATGGQ